MPHNKTLEEGLKRQQEDSELSVFWEEFLQHLPKSIERSALGDVKIFRAFKATYPKIRESLAEKLRASVVEEVEGMKTNAQEFAPPKNCNRNICTSCPEMRGRVNGYERAIEDLLAQLKNK